VSEDAIDTATTVLSFELALRTNFLITHVGSTTHLPLGAVGEKKRAAKGLHRFKLKVAL
jgi:hypothetical protein